MKSPNFNSRRANKPLMERKRRARINDYLTQLKDIVLLAMKKENMNSSKFEKADILEMTVEYLKTIHRTKSLDSKSSRKEPVDQLKGVTSIGQSGLEDMPVLQKSDSNENASHVTSTSADFKVERDVARCSPDSVMTPISVNTSVNSTVSGVSYEKLCSLKNGHAKMPQGNISPAGSYRIVPTTNSNGHMQYAAIFLPGSSAKSTSPVQSSALVLPPNQLQQQQQQQQQNPTYMNVGTPVYISPPQTPNYVVTLQLVNPNNVSPNHKPEPLWRPW